jgi:hypothetical protein
MNSVFARALLLTVCLVAGLSRAGDSANSVVWEGDAGPGKGKHIVFIASDHEYRGEETLPALARILAKNYGFKCTFIVATDPATGFILPGNNNVGSLEAVASADLLVLFIRFQAFSDENMKFIDDYSNAAAR